MGSIHKTQYAVSYWFIKKLNLPLKAPIAVKKLTRFVESDLSQKKPADWSHWKWLEHFSKIAGPEFNTANLIRRLKQQEKENKRKLRLETSANRPAKAKKLATTHKLGFYSSDAWRDLRYRVLVKFGRKCMACGVMGSPAHVDHIKPRSKYPELELEFDNLQVLCEACNMGKRAWDETDWRPKN